MHFLGMIEKHGDTYGCSCVMYVFVGAFCSEDFDGCADNPCMGVSNCTDMSAWEQTALGRAFTCSQCPDGYEMNDNVCVGALNTMAILSTHTHLTTHGLHKTSLRYYQYILYCYLVLTYPKIENVEY